MIIKDKIGNLLKFVRICGLKKSGYLFGKFYAVFEDGKFTVWNRNITEFERVIYKPREVVVDENLDRKNGYKDGVFWGKVEDFDERLKGHGISTEITLEIDSEMVRGKYLGHNFRFRNCERVKDAGQELSPENSYLKALEWAKNYNFFKYPEIEGNIGLDWFSEKKLEFCLRVDTSKFKEIIDCKRNYVNPSHYKINVNENGSVFLVISDDDTNRSGNEDTIELGDVEYKGEAFSNVYRTGFENIFENINGLAYIYFGVKTALVVHYIETESDKRTVLLDATYLITTASKTNKEVVSDEDTSETSVEPESESKPKTKKKKKDEKHLEEDDGEGESSVDGMDEEPEEVDSEFEEDTTDGEPEEVE